MTPRRTLALATASLAALASAASFTSSAVAAPGTPGVPGAPQVLFNETFEAGLADGSVTRLDAFKGGIYTADAPWLDQTNGNGLISDGTTTDQAFTDAGWASASANGKEKMRQVAAKIGELNGTSPTAANHAVTAWTSAANPGANLIEFAIEDPLDLAANGRFLTISANVGVVSCHAAHPAINFFLVDDGGAESAVNSAALDPCGGETGADTVVATTIVGGKAKLFESDSVGVVMRNAQGSGEGNDHGFDDIRVLDVTPQLDKTFDPSGPLEPGDLSTLTLTVTNTSELGEKAGWGFIDHLPEGLTVAGEPMTDCDGEGFVSEDGTEVGLEDGVLAQGQASCSIEVPVTATEGGVFENSAENIESVGLNAPGTTTVEYEVLDEPHPPVVDDPKTPGVPDTGADQQSPWPPLAALTAGALALAVLGGRRMLGRREV